MSHRRHAHRPVRVVTAVPGPHPQPSRRRAADIAALMLLGLRTDPGEDRVWERSWGNRVEIHQATGMVVAQLDLSATDAFARLRAYAFLEHRLLGDVARDVVARHLRFTQDT